MPNPKKDPPADVCARAYHYAQDPGCVTLEDIAAAFGVSDTTFSRWRKEDSGIDLAIRRARKVKGRKMFKKLEELAEEGNLKAIEMWQRYFRPDVGQPIGYGTSNQFNLLLQILPKPQAEYDCLIEHGAEKLIEEQKNILEQQPLTPLFQGRPVDG